MAILKVNERTVEGLQLEIDHHKREKAEYRRDNDSLRTDNNMLLEMLKDLTENESYWVDDVNTKTMLWRIKNLLNNINNC
jgi:FtsZ-binding cell division protein ZapB|tara:strand:- start:767 stop:1006 length:240 start_codon:yes stop_codon:yes gene_type:complete